MLETRSELLEKIRLGEDSFLELKEVRFAGEKVKGPLQDDIADEFAAFANSRGGVVLFGVDDSTREVLGIPLDKLDAVESLVKQACEDSVKPPLAPVIERMTLPDISGKEVPVLRVEVGQGLFVHQSPGGYFHRVGSSKRPILPDHLARLFQQRSQSRIIRFDETPVPSATLDDMSEPLWRRFAPDNNIEHRESLLGKLGMAAKDLEGVLRPTVAGILMGCEFSERFLPNAYIQVVRYAGTDIMPEGNASYQIDAADIKGPLDMQIFGACDFIRKNMLVAAQKKGTSGRTDKPQFDMLAIFEAVTNAVAHRDYSMYGSKIRIRMFDDRLEIYSPGMLPNTMTPESLPFRQSARNETIASLLARCPVKSDWTHRSHIMDKRGEGVPLILSRSEALSGRRPQYFLIDSSELLLKIYAAVDSEL
ncbi:MAG: ATP-binding protein [Rectinema sp.]